jgi:hypothetical protein
MNAGNAGKDKSGTLTLENRRAALNVVLTDECEALDVTCKGFVRYDPWKAWSMEHCTRIVTYKSPGVFGLFPLNFMIS